MQAAISSPNRPLSRLGTEPSIALKKVYPQFPAFLASTVLALLFRATASLAYAARPASFTRSGHAYPVLLAPVGFASFGPSWPSSRLTWHRIHVTGLTLGL